MNLARRGTRQWVPSEHTSDPPKAVPSDQFFLGSPVVPPLCYNYAKDRYIGCRRREKVDRTSRCSKGRRK